MTAEFEPDAWESIYEGSEMKSRAEKRKQWWKLYLEYKETEQNCKAFCRDRKVSYYSMKAWVKRFDEEGGLGNSFTELPAISGMSFGYSIVLRNGREIRLPEYFTESRARRLIELCEQC